MANVSTATVSHVLNGTARISDETRGRVLEAVKKTNYKPNSIAKSLKIKRTNTIGIITEDITVFNTPEIINGINEYAEIHGYHILLNNIRLFQRVGNNYRDTRKFTGVISDIVNDLLSRQVEGIIYVGAHCRDVSGLIENSPVPVVYAYCHTAEGSEASICYDDEEAAYEITNYLIKRGHIKIGVVTGLFDSVQCQDRLKGYQRALYEANLLFNPQYTRCGSWEFEKGRRAGKELLSLPEPPTAVFVMNDVMAGGVLEAAGELGISVPAGLSVAGFDNRECSSAYSPGLTTMALPLNEIGKISARILIELVRGEEASTDPVIKLRCRLIERESVGGP